MRVKEPQVDKAVLSFKTVDKNIEHRNFSSYSLFFLVSVLLAVLKNKFILC